jgi:hypothetical protein
MVRVLAPGGLLVFQMPIHVPWRNRLQIRRRAYQLLHRLGISESYLYERLKLSPIRMVGLSEDSVKQAVHEAGGIVLDVTHTKSIGYPLTSGHYYCTRD